MIDLIFLAHAQRLQNHHGCSRSSASSTIVIPVNIGAGDQFKPEFLKISPNNRMPAMTDPDGPGGKPISIFESGAILMYLAEKTGKLMPVGTRGKYNVIQWLMFQMAQRRPDARPGASLPPLRAGETSSTRSIATPTRPSASTA